MIDTRVLVIGAGAIGGITAAMLAGAVSEVAVLDASAEHVARLRDPGVVVELLDGDVRSVPLRAVTSAAELEGRYDFGLIALKAPALEVALPPLAARGLVQTFVSLGNGLVHERIASIVGREHLIVGTVEWGATNLGPGRLRQTTDNPFVIGELDGPPRTRTRALASALAPVAEVRVTDNIQGQLWSKLLVNSTLSGLGVVGGCTYAEVAADQLGREAIFRVWREGHELGVAQGLELEPVLGVEAAQLASDDPAVRSAALEVAIARAGATKASMLQDVERGSRTEVDVINGGVVTRARELGREAPLNERIVAIVQGYERGERRPSRELFAQVLA
ncbi:MAG: ketopantoate reductase family protein [Solirubrobacteraceae bacterium]